MQCAELSAFSPGFDDYYYQDLSSLLKKMKTESRILPSLLLVTRDDVVSQRLNFGTTFLSSSWESKIVLLF